MAIPSAVKDAAQKLLDMLKSYKVRNVFVWKSHYRGFVVGLSGKALPLQQYLLDSEAPKSNFRNHLNKRAADFFNIDIQEGPRRDEVNPQFWYQPDVPPSDFLDGLGRLVEYAADLTEEEVEIVIIPEPGYPWRPDRVVRYYDAKKDREIVSKKPEWAILGRYDQPLENIQDKEGYVADYCKLFPVVSMGEKFPETLIQMPRTEAIVTHTFDVPLVPEGEQRKRMIKTAHEIKKCGGLLFPSLAVGPIPAANFGPVTFVLNAGCVLSGLHPYRPRGRYPVVLYNTDVWTETVGAIKKQLARDLFRELTGYGANYIYQSHLFALGPTLQTDRWVVDDQAKRLKNVKQMESQLRKRFRQWPSQVTPEKWTALHEEPGLHSYAYLEAKVANILALDNIRFVVCEKNFVKSVRVFLKSLGIKVPVYPVDGGEYAVAYTDETMEKIHEVAAEKLPEIDSWKVYDYFRYHYAWKVAEAIREISKREGGVVQLDG